MLAEFQPQMKEMLKKTQDIHLTVGTWQVIKEILADIPQFYSMCGTLYLHMISVVDFPTHNNCKIIQNS